MDSHKNIPEEFLQYIWENNLFYSKDLVTSEGEKLEVIKTGTRNSDAGPDFFNAKIKIGNTVWAGNVEIHKKASDWFRHDHQNDKKYRNIILHVVETADHKIYRENDEEIPLLVLNYPENYKNNYQRLLEAQTWIACEEQFFRLDPMLIRLGFNRLMIDRLEQKTGEIAERLKSNNHNWNETFYQVLARIFGFKVNAVPFELLAKALPLGILAKHKNNLLQLEALIFGTSGLLNEELLGDEYYLKLRQEYTFLYKKYDLKIIEAHLWKFMRLRPVNFPTIRMAQLAALIFCSSGLFSKITEIDKIDELKELFRVKASSYWKSHYRFNKTAAKSHPVELGESSVNSLIINVVVPFLFVYGEMQDKHFLKNRALEFLEQLPSENNSIIKKWNGLGITARSAFESQALLQLKNMYCSKKKCLNCQIGNKLVKTIADTNE